MTVFCDADDSENAGLDLFFDLGVILNRLNSMVLPGCIDRAELAASMPMAIK